MDLHAGVIVVTGAASGLGAATCTWLAAQGATVFGIDKADDAPGGAYASADVCDEVALLAALKEASAMGPLRAAVHCAGIVASAKILGQEGPAPLEDFRRVVEVNLVGSFNLLRLASALMADTPLRGEERGVVVLTSSIAAYEGQVGQAAYAAAKAGVAGLVLPAARELARHAVRVVGIAPGIMDTPIMARMPQTLRDGLAANVPYPRRLGTGEEFARLAQHAIENHYLNGEVIRLDGGLRMPPR
ncbi:SDR family NAD(P)-dependent oxidoreductase [Niveibacterium sp. SC-1]|uniref:SDR family NAD(P)-dependent oxidoreductase n=1 Tax=Niveibacterium sp. SC-1 TaxID=3135646 RepID=UPI00311EE921